MLQVVHQYTGAGHHVAGQGHREGLLHGVHLQRVAHHDVSLSDDQVVDAVHPAVSSHREDHVLVHLHVQGIFCFFIEDLKHHTTLRLRVCKPVFQWLPDWGYGGSIYTLNDK